MEKPLLQCAKCGQSSHKSCIIDLVKTKMNSLITNESELTQEDILKFINPLSFPGMHYLCKPCEVDHISTQLNCTINVEEPDTEIELETEPAETTTVSESTAEIPSSNTPNEQIIINSASNNNASSTSPALETTSKTTIQIPATCRFYKRVPVDTGAKERSADSTILSSAKNSFSMGHASRVAAKMGQSANSSIPKCA